MSDPGRVIQKIEATHNTYTAFVLWLLLSHIVSDSLSDLYLSIVPIETDMAVTKASTHDVHPVNMTFPLEFSHVISNRGGC